MPASTAPPSSSAGALSSGQRRYLRGMCHDLRPIILLGAKGASEAVTKELGLALDQHELVKIKLSGGDRAQRKQQIDTLIEATNAQLVQTIGHTASVFRRNEDDPKLALPRR